MATFATYQAQDGSTQKVPIPEGADPAATVDAFETERQRQIDLTRTPAPPPILDDPSPVSGSISEAQELRGITDPLIGTNVPTTTQERVERGLSLGGRTVAGAIPKAATGVADLGATILNLIPELISRGDVALGGKPLEARLPTGATESLEELLNEVFPEPQGILENIAVEGGQFALSGGAADIGLASRAVQTLLPTASRESLGSTILTEIGQSVAKNPKTAAVAEIGGGTGAITGAELGEKADLGPGGRAIATTIGGLLGGGTPVLAANRGRALADVVAETFVPGTKKGSELRAARRVQDVSEDIRGDVQAIRDRPEGVLPGRATGDEGLLALEAKVLVDDPKFKKTVTEDLAAAEGRTLTELADQFGPKTNKAEWQQEVILQGTPDGASIKIGQPDDMIAQSAKAFDKAYDEVRGFNIQTQNLDINGKQTTLRIAIEDALSDPDILTTPAIQERVSSRIQSRLTRLEQGGEFIEGTVAVQTSSDDFLSLRQAIRKKERQLAKTAATNADAAEEAALLDNVNQVLTAVLDSQLPAEASAALRATDARYGQFKVVESAINRSGTAGLTPEALRASVKASGVSAGKFARGETGELGRLAETGRDVSKVLGKPEEAARLVRNMTPEQKQRVKADLKSAIADKSQAKGPTKNTRLDGTKYLDNLSKQRETLKAAGFTDKDIKNLETAARELKVVQAVSGKAVERLLTDNVNTVIRFLGAVAGSTSATKALRFFGGGGSGPSLILAGFGSTVMKNRLKNLSIDQAQSLIEQAFRGEVRIIDGKEVALLEALLTKPTAGLAKQAQAAATINAFLIPAAQIPEEEE